MVGYKSRPINHERTLIPATLVAVAVASAATRRPVVLLPLALPLLAPLGGT